MTDNIQNVFLIINLSCLGDVILTNTLVSSLKQSNPNKKIVFVVDKPYYEAAKYQYGVDDVLIYDKRNKNKGILGLLKFVFSCKYRNNIDASFIIYGNFRGILLSCLLGAKRRISSHDCITKYLLTDTIDETYYYTPIDDVNSMLFSAYLKKEAKVVPSKFLVSVENNSFISKLKSDYKEMIGFCPVTEDEEKNMPLQSAVQIIEKLSNENKTVLFLGKGIEAREYSDNLKKMGCTKFVDLTNITSISNLANVLSVCKGTISIDTGTMHLSYSVNCPTVCVFYKKINVPKWAPNPFVYNVSVIDDDFSPDNICNKLNNLLMPV